MYVHKICVHAQTQWFGDNYLDNTCLLQGMVRSMWAGTTSLLGNLFFGVGDRYWGLNLGPHAYDAGGLPFESHLHSFPFFLFFTLVILEIGSHFHPGHPGSWLPYFMLPAIAGMTGTYHHSQFFSVEMASHTLFCLNWSRAVILPISASKIAWTLQGWATGAWF
jgi:hypothetical protein